MGYDQGSGGNNSIILSFLKQPGLQRMWPLVRKKYESHDRAAGSVFLSAISKEEREALEGLFAANLLGQSEIRIPLKKLEHALLETRFRLTVEDCLNLLYGAAWSTRRKQRETEMQTWEQFCIWASRSVETQKLKYWVEQLGKGSGLGYRTFLECYREYGETGTSPGFERALVALQQLPADQERLPVYAARTTGDPHGLDRSTLAGRVFYWGMLALQDTSHEAGDLGQEDSNNEMDPLPLSEEIRNQYARAGVILDDISSIVWVAGWGNLIEPVALPLWTVERLERKSMPLVTEVVVVENPSIFGALVDAGFSKGKYLPVPLVCTSGQPSLAALKLLDKMLGEQTRLLYSGDFDVKGLSMGIGLARRYGSRFAPWRFDATAYQNAVWTNNPQLSDAEKAALAKMEIPWDNQLSAVMRNSGRKAYQEQILELLLEDWM